MRFSPKIDVAFRKLFGSEQNKDILISLINSIVAPWFVVEQVVLKNPYNLADYVGGKSSILDIKARAQNGVWYNIELQVSGSAFYGKRAVYYGSKLFVDQLEEGMEFSDLNTTVGIHLLDFDFFKDERYVRHFALKDMETGQYHEQLGSLHFFFVEMKKFRKDYGKLAGPLDRWIAFLNHAEEWDRRSLPEPLQEEPAIVKAATELERMSLDAREREIYEAEVKATMVDKGQLQYAKEEGRVEGIAEGEAKGKSEGKEELLALQLQRRFSTLPTDITEKLDKLTAEQLDELGLELFNFSSLAELESWLASR